MHRQTLSFACQVFFESLTTMSHISTQAAGVPPIDFLQISIQQASYFPVQVEARHDMQHNYSPSPPNSMANHNTYLYAPNPEEQSPHSYTDLQYHASQFASPHHV